MKLGSASFDLNIGSMFCSLEENLNKGMKTILVCLMLALALAQTDFQNTCQSESLIPRLATGLINLNPLDTYNSGANKDYYQDLTLNGFSSNDVLGYGFALSGFETSCSNTFYALVIDDILFENQNTRMKIVVDFRDPGSGAITSWTMVSFTYIVVSRFLNGAYSDIWATVASISNPLDNIPQAIDAIGAAYQVSPNGGGRCEIFEDPNIVHDEANACEGTAVDSTGATGGAHIVHAYIMGFRYNPAQSTTRHLIAGVLPAYPADFQTMETTDTGAALGVVTIDYTAVLSGPQVSFTNPDSAITFIKIAFVHSRFDMALSDVIVGAGLGTYPSQSNMIYSSSYIFTSVGTTNSAVSITQGAAVATEFNQKYYHLPDTRYAIYGLTGFEFPTGTSCTTIKINATLDNIDTYTVTTPNTATNLFFVADIFTKNIDQLCQPGNNQLLASQVFTVGQKSYFTIPTESVEQYIIEEPVGAPVPLPNGIAAGEAFVFQYYAAENGNTDKITYRVEIPFNGLIVGAPIKFIFGFFDNQLTIDGGVSGGMNPGTEYDIKLEVNGFVLYH